jgi:hypothetical protein
LWKRFIKKFYFSRAMGMIEGFLHLARGRERHEEVNENIKLMEKSGEKLHKVLVELEVYKKDFSLAVVRRYLRGFLRTIILEGVAVYWEKYSTN